MNQLARKMRVTSNYSETQNGALSYHSTGSVVIDQFGKVGSYLKRSFSDISHDCDLLAQENIEHAIRFAYYVRIISRISSDTKVQMNGPGLRNEFYGRMVWLSYNSPDIFIHNLDIVPVIGTWKDMVELFQHVSPKCKDAVLQFFVVTMLDGEDDLMKKYLPQFRAMSKLNSDRAKARNLFAYKLMRRCDMDPKAWREYKTSGTAHVWQQLISRGLEKQINFNLIPGIAMKNMVKSGWFTKHGLEKKFHEWLMSKPVVKYNGYAHDLYEMAFSGTPIQKMTADKQFETLVVSAPKSRGNVMSAIDLSGSMYWDHGMKVKPAYIAQSLAYFFDRINGDNAFKGMYIEFASNCQLCTFEGKTFSTAIAGIRRRQAKVGSTNFRSVIDMLIDYRKANPSIPVTDYPQYILIVSDLQFDPVYDEGHRVINSKYAEDELAKVGLGDISFIWWQVNAKYGKDVPATLESGKNYFFSGFDGSIINFLLGLDYTEKAKPEMQDVIYSALYQDILSHLRVS